MKKIKLSNLFVILLPLAALAQVAPLKASSLDDIKQLIAEKKAGEAVALLKSEHRRLVKSEKDFNDLERWLSVFQFEESMSAFERALELSTKDVDGAKAEFDRLLKVEPHNKTVWAGYITFLINEKKLKEAAEAVTKATDTYPYFGVFPVYSATLALEAGQLAPLASCDQRALNAVELEFCHLIRLRLRVSPGGTKKPTKNEVRRMVGMGGIPDFYYWAWVLEQDEEDLKKYVSLCKNMSEKDKKKYRNIPHLCAKISVAETQLQPKKSEDAGTQ